MNLIKELKSKQDLKYRDFSITLVPSVDPNSFIGVRIPDLRKIAKEYYKEGNYQKFLISLPHKYYEENMIHAFVIGQIKDFDTCIKEINRFLPYANSWSITDSMAPKMFSKHKEALLVEIKKWLKSKETYTLRFAVDCLMTFYLDEDFDPKHLDLVANIKSKEYYVNMMRAWYFATALAKQKEVAIKYIEDKKLDDWTHNKSIQKAVESYRISDKDKKYLKTLKV